VLQVIIDTSEQRPWAFPAADFETRRKKLREGDYTLVGAVGRLSIERKSLGDFVGTVIHDWLRFRKELIRLSGYDVAAVVVEADIGDVIDHKYESDANPDSVLGKANGIYLDHGIPVLWWGKRPGVERMAARFLKLAAAKLGIE